MACWPIDQITNMIQVKVYDETRPRGQFKSYSNKNRDRRHNNIHRYLEKYQDTKLNVCLIINESYILPCMDLIYKQKLTSEFDKIIIYFNELFWDSFNDSKILQDKVNKIDDSEKITIIFNFFCDRPFDLENINYITSIGGLGEIARHYLDKYKFKSLRENYKNIKYNVISKFGNPSGEKILVYNKIKEFKNIIYSINSSEGYLVDSPDIDISAIKFPSEVKASDGFRDWLLPEEDFQSASEVVVETRFSTFEDGKRLVTNSEKTLKGFMFRRPVFLFAQPESYPYLKQYGFKFPKLFGYDGTKVKQVNGSYETEHFDMVERVCNTSTKDILDFFIEKEDIWEHNYENLYSFIELHDNRMENVFRD